MPQPGLKYAVFLGAIAWFVTVKGRTAKVRNQSPVSCTRLPKGQWLVFGSGAEQMRPAA